MPARNRECHARARPASGFRDLFSFFVFRSRPPCESTTHHGIMWGRKRSLQFSSICRASQFIHFECSADLRTRSYLGRTMIAQVQSSLGSPQSPTLFDEQADGHRHDESFIRKRYQARAGSQGEGVQVPSSVVRRRGALCYLARGEEARTEA